jgi:hypothetical protein
MDYVVVNTPVRFQGPTTHQRVFGPLDGTMDYGICIGCDKPFEVGQYMTILPVGPGGDEDDRRKAFRGGWYSCNGVPLHAECAGIDPTSHPEE